MPESYDAAAIEVLSGLDPVRKRPGMFTDTTRPNHLAHEVIDNSVDEAIAGHARRIDVTLHEDNSLEVRDDGRGMPVDLHPEKQVPGVEVILTRCTPAGSSPARTTAFRAACTASACRWSTPFPRALKSGCGVMGRNTA